MSVNYPTEITELPDKCGYSLVKPIPITVTPDDQSYIASANNLAMMICGHGETPDASRDDLAECVVGQADINAKHKAEGKELIGLAALCDKTILEYLKPTG